MERGTRFDQSWRFSTPSEALDTVCDLMTPTRVDDVDTADDATLRNQATQWRSEIDSLRGSYDTDHATEHLAQARRTRRRSAASGCPTWDANAKAAIGSTARPRPPQC